MADDMDFDKDTRNDHPGELIYETKYKGKPVLVMRKSPEDKWPLSMGLTKVRLCLENYESMQAFADKYGKEKD